MTTCPTWCGTDHALDRAGALPQHSRQVAALPGEVRVGVVWTPDLSPAHARRALITAPRPGQGRPSPHVLALAPDDVVAFAAILRTLIPAQRSGAVLADKIDRLHRLAGALDEAAGLLSMDAIHATADPAADVAADRPERPERRKVRP